MLHAPKAFHKPRRFDKSASRYFSRRQALIGPVFGRHHVCHPVIDLVLGLQFAEKYVSLLKIHNFNVTKICIIHFLPWHPDFGHSGQNVVERQHHRCPACAGVPAH